MIEAIFSEEVGKRMIVQCPMCCKHRNMNYRAFLLQGHTFCRKCSPIYFNNYIVGKQFGELTVLSIFSNGKGIVCKCLCSCGKKCHTDYHTWNGGFWVPATRESFEEWIKCH